MPFKSLKPALVRFLAEEDGPTAVEYAIMLAMIMIACLSALNLLSEATSTSLDDSATKISDKMAGN